MATINGTSVGGMTLVADYSYTQNTSANTSTVTVTLKLTNHYALYATAISGSYISVGGSKTNYTKSISYGGTTTTSTTLATKTVTVTHNSNGTATCNISGTFVMNGTYRGSSVGTMSVSQTITLPTIPRSSSLTVPTTINTGATLSGTVTPSSSAFNHKVYLKTGSTTRNTISLAAGTKTFSDVIEHSWFPSSTSGTLTVVLETYNGTTLVASTSKSVTANVPTSIVPSVSALTATVVDGKGGYYVQNKSKVTLAATATAGTGASIKSYTFSGTNMSASGTTASATSSVLQYSGAKTYTVTVTDTRGRTASKNVSITVQPYAAPTISSISVQRCTSNGTIDENGTYAYVTVNSSYSTINGANTRTVVLTNSGNSTATTVQATTNTSGSWSGVYGSGFSVGTTYTITATIKDTAYSATATKSGTLKAASRPMNIKSNGKGIGIGKMAESDNLLDVSWNERVRGNLSVDGTVTLTKGLSAPLPIASGGTGVTTASSLARTHIHNDITGASSSGGTLGYLRIARVQITAGYVNQPIEIKFSRRLDSRPTTISLIFHNSSALDPGYAAFVVDGPAPTWLHKAGTSTWDIYVQKAESYDYIGILDAKYTDNLLEKLTITFTDVFAASVPSGAIEATKIYDDYIIGQGTSGAWTYRKWSTGVAECWGTLNGTLSPYTSINGFSAYEGSVSFPSNLFTASPNVQFQPYIGNGFAIPARGVISTATQCKWVALSNVSTANTTVKVDVFAIGKWK